jgi:predicted GNAT family acetyltransferase
MIDINEVEIINNPDESRFEAHVEGQLAVLDYRQDEEKIIYIHTGVPAEIEARGIGTKLAKTGLEYARDNGLDVIPLCPFVAAYIRAHPEYQSLVRHGPDKTK